MVKTLDISNLSFSYEAKVVLKDIDLEATEGEFIGIMGANGCGKSTLIRQILRIFKPQVGFVEILGKPIENYSHKELASLIGFLPQKSALSMPLLVEDILLMGRYSTMRNSVMGYNRLDNEKINVLAQMLDINHLKKRVALTLSGGEFQRVLLGRALASEPRILLLDEPTSALDINYAIEIMKICENLTKNAKITCIAVLHDVNLASLFCTKIFFLKDKKIAYSGSVEELFCPEILKEIYGFACDVINHRGRVFVIPKKEEK